MPQFLSCDYPHTSLEVPPIKPSRLRRGSLPNSAHIIEGVFGPDGSFEGLAEYSSTTFAISGSITVVVPPDNTPEQQQPPLHSRPTTSSIPHSSGASSAKASNSGTVASSTESGSTPVESTSIHSNPNTTHVISTTTTTSSSREQSTPTSNEVSSGESNGPHAQSPVGAIVGTVVSAVVLIALVATGTIVWRRRRRRRDEQLQAYDVGQISGTDTVSELATTERTRSKQDTPRTRSLTHAELRFENERLRAALFELREHVAEDDTRLSETPPAYHTEPLSQV